MDIAIINVIIILLIILFVIGVIFLLYWLWHKSRIKRSKRINHNYPKLVLYIHKAKKHGLTKKQIKNELKKQGWPDKIIDQYI